MICELKHDSSEMFKEMADIKLHTWELEMKIQGNKNDSIRFGVRTSLNE